MTKREIKSATNQALLEWLLSTSVCHTVTKSRDNTAQAICNELEKREVISSGEGLHKVWRG